MSGAPFDATGISPFSIPGIPLVTPNGSMAEAGDDDCLSEEDPLAPDDELGPGTLGSLPASMYEGMLDPLGSTPATAASGGRVTGWDFRHRTSSVSADGLLADVGVIDLTPSILAQHNKLVERKA